MDWTRQKIESHFIQIQKQIRERLSSAERDIKVAVAWFTDPLLLDILVQKAQRGLRVEVVLSENELNKELDFSRLTNAGGKVFLYPRRGFGVMHHKYCVIDDRTVITGSYNWTVNASKNNGENIVIIKDTTTVKKYLENFRRILSGKPENEPQPEGQEPDTDLATIENESTVKGNWITDERQLREEGALFGWTGSPPDEKLKAIASYFDKQIAAIEERLSLKQSRLEELKEKIEEEKEKRNEKSQKIPPDYSSWNQTNRLILLIAKLVAYVGIGVLFFFVIYPFVVQTGLPFPELITLGVYLGGSMTLYHNVGVLFTSNKAAREQSGRELWKIYLEETIMPLLASVFIVFITYEAIQNPLWSAGIFLFMTLFFLLVGRGFLTLLYELRKEWIVVRQNGRVRRDRQKEEKERRADLEESQRKLEELSKEQQEMEDQISLLNEEMKGLQKQKENAIDNFQSEYAFAKRSREILDQTTVDNIDQQRENTASNGLD